MLADAREQVVVPAPVVVELDRLSRRRLGPEPISAFSSRRSRTALREARLATLDHRHFRTIRPRHVDALELLPA
jgi:hypothetical protein